jgi:hypothetical protein
MARKVFFSFHYQRDLWRANVVRNSGMIEGVAAAGFHNVSLWEDAERRGDIAVRRLIERALDNTTVTVVLIGLDTANRKYVSYEIDQSVARGNGILGIRINIVKDKDGHVDLPGPVPAGLLAIGAPVYMWEYGKLGEWVEYAHKNATMSY